MMMNDQAKCWVKDLQTGKSGRNTGMIFPSFPISYQLSGPPISYPAFMVNTGEFSSSTNTSDLKDKFK